MSKKTYDGYRSYSYLKKGDDYPDIPLAKDVDRVPSKTVELSDAEPSEAPRVSLFPPRPGSSSWS